VELGALSVDQSVWAEVVEAAKDQAAWRAAHPQPEDLVTAPAFSHGHDEYGPLPCRCPDEENLDGPEA
jgi:hypothetical protein